MPNSSRNTANTVVVVVVGVALIAQAAVYIIKNTREMARQRHQPLTSPSAVKVKASKVADSPTAPAPEAAEGATAPSDKYAV